MGPEDLTAKYERLLAIERERRRRGDQLEPLLSTIANALDIREIFPQLSDVIQPVIPHATVSLALLTPDGRGVKVRVASNYDVPPLRERSGDILLLAEAFLAESATSVGRPAAGLSEDARDLLARHPWPGNVRELRNAIERAVILCEGGLVTGEHLPITVAAAKSAQAAGTNTAGRSEDLTFSVVERDLIQKALTSAHNNKSKAAQLLGVPRGQFYSMLRRHPLTSARR